MLLQSYKITRILPCLADPEKIRVIAELSDEIHEIFPYLNATIKGCIYNHPANTLTVKKDGKLLTLRFNHITLAKVEDKKEAEEILQQLKDLINETYQNRDQIEPNYSKGADLKALDIFKLLPGTNCKRCGEPVQTNSRGNREFFSNFLKPPDIRLLLYRNNPTHLEDE